jgi:hypothetical protein
LAATISYQNVFSFLFPHETKVVKMQAAHIECFDNRAPGAGVNSWAKQGVECMREYKIGGTCNKNAGDEKPIQNCILEM